MKIILGILQALFYLPINLFVTAIAWIISPVLPMFASSDGWLPRWLWWFQTPDNSIGGDHSFNKPSLHPYITKMPRYIRRVLWLIRNPSYGFFWTVMATKPLPKEWKYSGDINCSRKLKATSWIYLTCGNYFHFRAYLKYPGINYCFQINMGWNMHEMCRNGVQEGRPAKYRFTPHPLKRLG